MTTVTETGESETVGRGDCSSSSRVWEDASHACGVGAGLLLLSAVLLFLSSQDRSFLFAQPLVWVCCVAVLFDPGKTGNLKLTSPFQGFSFCLNLDQVAATFVEAPLPFGDKGGNAPRSG